MAVAGYRATEDGNTRILQNGDTRVTENYYTVDCNLSASSNASFFGTFATTGAAALVSSGTLVASGNLTTYTTTLLANNSNLSALGDRTTVGNIAFLSSSAISIIPHLIKHGDSVLTSTSTVSATGRSVKFVSILSGTSEFVRILENENSRITESGDFRVTNPISTNVISSSLVAIDTYIPFGSIPYYKQNGVWKISSVYAKNNGDWDALQTVYKNISGSWKRIY